MTDTPDSNGVLNAHDQDVLDTSDDPSSSMGVRLLAALQRQELLVPQVQEFQAANERRIETLQATNRRQGLMIGSLVVVLLILGALGWNVVRITNDLANSNARANRTAASALISACVQRNGFQAAVRQQFEDYNDALGHIVPATPEAQSAIATLALSIHTPAVDDRDCDSNGILNQEDYPAGSAPATVP